MGYDCGTAGNSGKPQKATKLERAMSFTTSASHKAPDPRGVARLAQTAGLSGPKSP